MVRRARRGRRPAGERSAAAPGGRLRGGRPTSRGVSSPRESDHLGSELAERSPSKGLETRGFWVWIALLTAASLWPIWANRLLPMQDYAQHLFIATVLGTFSDPGFD